MKKSISILAIFFIALISFNSSAQSVIGTWEGMSTRSGESPNEPMNGEIHYVQTFNADNSGLMSFNGITTGNLDQNTQLRISLRGKIPFTWAKDGSNVTMKLIVSQFELNLTENDIEFISNDPNIQAMMNAYKPQMVEMFYSQLKTALGTSISETSTWTNVKIEGDKMYVTEKGKDYELTRIK